MSIITTPNLGLIVWTATTDDYDHAQLAANFFALDQHNHGDAGGRQIPTSGVEDGAITEEKLSTSLATALGL